MRSVLTSVAILSLILLFCVSSATHVSGLAHEAETYLKQAIDQDDPAQISQVVATASAFWKQHEDYFALVRCHSELDQISTDFARLEAYANSSDQDDFRSTCAALLANLKRFRDAEWPFYFNIL